ncbi:MAG: RNA polymerase sigma factor [Bacteroidales bacterium]|nr:RNA polymerase sigma factor [Bacteroidales bacterium]
MNDEDLLKQLRSGNNESYRYLIDTHRNLVWNISLRMTGSKSVSEDLFQEVFFRVYKDIGKFRGESKLSTWIGSISFNVCSDYLRRKNRQRIFEDVDIANLEQISPWDKNPGAELYSLEINEIVAGIIDNLKTSYKVLINLYHIEEFSYKEIAEITKMPVGTIKSYLNRARAIIKDEILKNVPDFKEIHYESFV